MQKIDSPPNYRNASSRNKSFEQAACVRDPESVLRTRPAARFPGGGPGKPCPASLDRPACAATTGRPSRNGSEDTRLFSHVPEAGRPRCRRGQGWSLLSLSPGRVDVSPPYVPSLLVDPLRVSLKTLSPKLVPNASRGCGARPVNVERHSSAQQKRCRFSTK